MDVSVPVGFASSLRKHKRKWSGDITTADEASYMKRWLDGASMPLANTEPDYDSRPYGSCVRWEEYYGLWPPPLEFLSVMKGPSPAKRTCTSASYAQRVQDGSLPSAWKREHARNMQEAGLIMNDYQQRTEITPDSKKLYEDLLKMEYRLPDRLDFQADWVEKLLARVSFCNEARTVRDVLPLVVPSAELLYLDVHMQIENLCEALNTEWTQCETICGPRPKPTFAVGASPSAFVEEEIRKLKMCHTSACPNLFPEEMYFPFLVCEVKEIDHPFIEAERQVMHCASIAVRALVQFYRKIESVAEIDQTILVFSVAHNPSEICIHGHFAKTEGENTTYFRRELFSAHLRADQWKKAHQVIRAIYDIFYPQHLARIKYVLSNMPSPLASVAPWFELEGDSQDLTADSCWEEDDQSTLPLPPVVQAQQETVRFRDCIDEDTGGAQHVPRPSEHVGRQMVQLAQQMELQRERQTEQELAQQWEQELAQQWRQHMVPKRGLAKESEAVRSVSWHDRLRKRKYQGP